MPSNILKLNTNLLAINDYFQKQNSKVSIVLDQLSVCFHILWFNLISFNFKDISKIFIFLVILFGVNKQGYILIS